MSALSRPLAADLLRFDIESEVFRMSRSPALERSGRCARTLLKDGALRVTLVALAPGGRIGAHRAAGPITLQPVLGSILVRVPGKTRELAVGHLLCIGPGVEHAVESPDGGAFLLTLAGPGQG